ncbi:type II secretion system F family protein [Nitratidesulfovibrio vulgaris]|nr:type II secretion system F family protein [Nitratidesulfovibrio vulgaris]GEB80479.1 hypothetical protein DDE01_18940 [Desulfovibrio desulfuricans]HBW16726.1 type II secretion system F family protein [Desulfovibrio sp.]ABM28127.1 type II secretion system protein [Nitratidesulfovibrio vulgaris DP4]ADP87122.1 Type II secretion system F domain protein [Nitratidesulfovibrio vulgaris RCH1]WCB45645.1 type II secretion system F family protein [Nitratidesulfovibrio vulgaris]
MIDETSLTPLLAALLAGASVLLAFFGVQGMRGSRRRIDRMQSRVARHLDRNAPTAAASATTLSDDMRRGINAMAERLGQRVINEGDTELTEAGMALARAGYRNRTAPRVFWGVKAGLTVAGLLMGLTVRLLLGDDVPAGMVALLFIGPAVTGLYLPNIWLSSRIKERRQEIINALPDALDLLVVCVEAGMGLDQALARVAKELQSTSPVLAEELQLSILELRAGKSRADTLKNLAARVAIEDVNSLVTLIIQADAFGTSIASTLRVYSDTMRTTRFQRAEEIAAKMPVKLLFPLVFCILPALFVTIMGPAFIKLMQVFAQMNQ